MNKKMFDGFNDIKADEKLVSKTKKAVHTKKIFKRFSMQKISAATALIAAALIFIIFFIYSPASNSSMTASAQNLMDGITPQKVDTTSAMSDNFIKSTQNFSMNIFKASVKDGKNSLISPASLFLTLGMTANGTDKDTLNEFKKVLGKYCGTLDELNNGYKAYSDYICKKQGSTNLNIANSIWYDSKRFKPLNSFLQTNANYYNSGMMSINFNDKSSVDVINNWVKENTQNKIDKIVDKIDRDDVMFLVNAVCFNGKWQKSFDASLNKTAPFFLENGKSENATFMNSTGELNYFINNNTSAVMLPYDDDRFILLCILPNENIKLSDYIKTLNSNSILDIMNNKKHDNISISLPKFKTSFSTKLNDALKEMGLGKAFNANADFSKMGSGSLFISSVTHKTFFEVDENGTTVSASTKVEIRKQCALPYVFNFNRPFIYSIIDTKTNIPLFIGAIENPNQN